MHVSDWISRRLVAAFALSLLTFASVANAQQPPAGSPAPNPATVCGLPIPEPRALPPAGSGPVIYQVVPCFDAQDNTALIDIQTYLYYIKLRGSQPSQGIW